MKRARDEIHILTPEFSAAVSLVDEIHGQNVYRPSPTSPAPGPPPPLTPNVKHVMEQDYSTLDDADFPTERVQELRARLDPGAAPLALFAPLELRARLPKRLDFRPVYVEGEPVTAESFVALQPEDDIFAHCFGADLHLDLVHSPFTLDENVVLGTLGVLGRLLVVSPVLRSLYSKAPEAPHLEFHHLNVMLGALKCASRRAAPAAVRLQRLQQTLAFVIKAFDHYAPPKVIFPGKERLLMRYLYPLQLLLGLAPRLTADFVCTGAPLEHDEEDDEDINHHCGVRVEGLMVDALRVAPDEEAASLADLMRDFEDQLSPASATCNHQHPYERRSLSYGSRGPPPLLFFEAEYLPRGMPAHLLLNDTVITLGSARFTFAVAALLAEDGQDIVLLTEAAAHGPLPPLLIVYALSHPI